MIDEAEERGVAAQILGGAAEILFYGTAVIVE